MTVEEAITALMEFPLESELVICGHEFGYDDIVGWNVHHFEPTNDNTMVMIEGAGPPREPRAPEKPASGYDTPVHEGWAQQ